MTRVRALALLVAVGAAGGAWAAARPFEEIPVTSLAGEAHVLADVLAPGDDAHAIVLLWSLFDPASRRALRTLDQLAPEHAGEGVVVVAIALREYQEAPHRVATFVRSAGLALPVYLDATGAVRSALSRGKTPPLDPPALVWVQGSEVRLLLEGSATADPAAVRAVLEASPPTAQAEQG